MQKRIPPDPVVPGLGEYVHLELFAVTDYFAPFALIEIILSSVYRLYHKKGLL